MRSRLQNEAHRHEYGGWRKGFDYPQMNKGKIPLGYTIIHESEIRTCHLCGANEIRQTNE